MIYISLLKKKNENEIPKIILSNRMKCKVFFYLQKYCGDNQNLSWIKK